MSKIIKYRLKQKFSQLSKNEWDLAVKTVAAELGISQRTFFRDLEGEKDDIPHYRILQYAKFLSIDEKELEDFDRKEISVRPLSSLKEQSEVVETKDSIRSTLNLQKS